MTPSHGWSPYAHPPSRRPRGLLRRVCTKNPFYVLSAGLFLAGLWISFGGQVHAAETWALMSGLAGYTLLLAVTAWLLVRFGNVWDDVRTVLLLVVLMFLATSVTFDELLVMSPERGRACFLVGLLFAVLVSEGLLRGIRLKLPAWFRLPYYLILALFFLYPLALTPLLTQPPGEALQWGLFGFSPAAGLVFLTLLPAIRRGPGYVRFNGSPWPWPLYPWVLFGMLALAVPARTFLLCWSMHLLGGPDRFLLIFGPYFLVPFGLAIMVLLLEAGLVSQKRGALAAALVLPLGLVALAVQGHREDSVYRGFLDVFSARLGGDPLFLTLLALVGYYAYAALRRLPLASEAMTGVLAALAVVGPDTLDGGLRASPWPLPLLLAAALQLGLGLWRHSAWRCLLGTFGLAAVATLALPEPARSEPFRSLIAFHLGLLALLIVGALFDDAFGRLLRLAGAALALLAALTATFVRFDLPTNAPQEAVELYPLVMLMMLAGYGLLLGHRPTLAIAGVILVGWMTATGWRGYTTLRQFVSGLDYMVVSLAFFALAVLVSVAKSGVLTRWLAARRRAPD